MPTSMLLTPITVFWKSTTAVLASTSVESAVVSAVMVEISSAIASRMDVSLVVESSILPPAPHPAPHLQRYKIHLHYVIQLMGCT